MSEYQGKHRRPAGELSPLLKRHLAELAAIEARRREAGE